MSELDIATEIFSAYQEYIVNHYPQDPNIYIIRAHPETVHALLSKIIKVNTDFGYPWLDDSKDRFMGFRLEPDIRLSPQEIVFGPETVNIKWSR